jgi:SIR2-like protein
MAISTLTADELHNFVIGAKKVAFIVGSGLAMPSVPGVTDMLQIAAEEWEKALREKKASDFLDSLPKDGNRYQAAFKKLVESLGTDAANRVIRRAVLRARADAPTPTDAVLRGDATACSALEADTAGWVLTKGLAALGEIVARSGKVSSIFTTNFDPLIEVAVRRAGGRCSKSVLTRDGTITSFVSEDPVVFHLHGDWFRADTLHTPELLTAERPELKASLRRSLGTQFVVVVGYGGWDDVITSALTELATDVESGFELRWAFHEQSEDEIAKRYGRVIDCLGPALSRRVRLHRDIDAHKLLSRIADSFPPAYAHPARAAPAEGAVDARVNDAVHLWAALEFSPDGKATQSGELALWRLASAERETKRAFLRLLLDPDQPALKRRFLASGCLITRAVAALDPAIRNDSGLMLRAATHATADDERTIAMIAGELELSDCADHIGAALRLATLDAVPDLTRYLVALALANQSPARRTTIANALVEAMHNPNIVRARDTDMEKIAGLIAALPMLSEFLAPEQAASIAKFMVESLPWPGGWPTNVSWGVLGAVLGLPRFVVTDDQLSRAFEGMTDIDHNDADAPRGLAGLSSKLSAELAVAGIPRVLDLTRRAQSKSLSHLGHALRALLLRVSTAEDVDTVRQSLLKYANSLVEEHRHLQNLPQAARRSDDDIGIYLRFSALAPGLAALAARAKVDVEGAGLEVTLTILGLLSERLPEVVPLPEPLRSLWPDYGPLQVDGVHMLGIAVGAFASVVPDELISTCSDRVLHAINSYSRRSKPLALGAALGVLLARLDDSSVKVGVRNVLDMLSRTSPESLDRLELLARALEAVDLRPNTSQVIIAVLEVVERRCSYMTRGHKATGTAIARDTERVADVADCLLRKVAASAEPIAIRVARAKVYLLRRAIKQICSRHPLQHIVRWRPANDGPVELEIGELVHAVDRLRGRAIDVGFDTLDAAIRASPSERAVRTWFQSGDWSYATFDGLPYYLLGLAVALGRFPKPLTNEHVARVVTRFYTELRRTVDHGELEALTLGIALIAGRAQSDEAFAILIFEALKYPLAPREPLANAIRRRWQGAPEPEAGLWALVDWAKTRFNRFEPFDFGRPRDAGDIALSLSDRTSPG